MEQDRYAWQEKCLEVWSDNLYRGIVQAVTGAGKTMLALKAVAKLERDLGQPLKVKIVVPTKGIMSQWVNAIKRERLEDEFNGAMDACLASIGCRGGGQNDPDDRKYMIYIINSARYQLARSILAELKAAENVLLIVDECHHYTSGENQRIFDFVPLLPKLQGQYYALGLSATLQSVENESLLRDAVGKKIYNYSYEQALRYGTVCDFVVFQIAVAFQQDEAEEYENLSEGMRNVLTKLYACCPLLRDNGGAFFSLLKTLANGKRGKLADLARAYLKLAYRRKRIVCMAGNRLFCACRLLEQIGTEKQSIVFGESIEQAEALYGMLRAVYRGKVGRYHSKMGKQAKDNALERFRNGELRVLISCRALDEGIDVPEAAVGIILSGTSMERQRMQRLGRILRSAREKDVASLYYLFIKESREEKSYFAMHGDFFRTLDLEYLTDTDSFRCSDYERRMNGILDRWSEDKMEKAFMEEAFYCLRRGMLLPDWMLEEDQIREKLAIAKNTKERNYWICMLELAKTRCVTA